MAVILLSYLGMVVESLQEDLESLVAVGEGNLESLVVVEEGNLESLVAVGEGNLESLVVGEGNLQRWY